jgi:hypothetical protein
MTRGEVELRRNALTERKLRLKDAAERMKVGDRHATRLWNATRNKAAGTMPGTLPAPCCTPVW